MSQAWYCAALTAGEMEQARAMASAGQMYGAHHSERTHLEVRRLRELVQGDDIDWSSLDQAMSATVIARPDAS